MARPSRRVRRRLAQKWTNKISLAREAEQARKERQAVAHLKAIMPPVMYLKGGRIAVSVAKLTNSNATLAQDNLAGNSHSATGLYDGQPIFETARNAEGKLVYETREPDLIRDGIKVYLPTKANGVKRSKPVKTEVIREIRGYDAKDGKLVKKQRSIRARNQGSGKKRKSKVLQPLGQRINTRIEHPPAPTVLVPQRQAVIWVRKRGDWVPQPILGPETVRPKGEKPPKGFETLNKNPSGSTFIKRPKT